MITINQKVLYLINLQNDSFPKGFIIEIVSSYHKNKEFYEILLSNKETNDKKLKIFEEGIPKLITNIHSNGEKEIREITLEEVTAIVNKTFEYNAAKYIIDYCIKYLDKWYWKDYFPEPVREKKSA